MSLHTLAHHLQSAGRGEDKVLVHMTPGEVQGLQSLAMAHGGSLTINPETGLPEAGILSAILPMVAGFFLGPAGLGLSAMQSAVAVGALGTAATGSLGKGFMMGLGAYGGAGLGEGLTNVGGSTMSNVPGEFGVNAGTGTGADYAKWMGSDAGKLAATQNVTPAASAATEIASPVTNQLNSFSAYNPASPFANPNVSAYGAAPTAVVPPAPTAPLTNASDVFREGLASPSDFVRPSQGELLQNASRAGVEKAGTFTAPEAQPLTYDQATPTWDASKPATAPSNFDKAMGGAKRGLSSWEGAKEVWNATPTGTGYGLAATGMGVLQAQQEEAAAEAKAKADAMAAERRGNVRPYEFSTSLNENAFAPRESTSEFAYYTEPRYIAKPIEKVAKEGGIMSLAVGGTVEQMAAQNAVGQNTMYPQSQLQTPMYANPMVQRPMPNDVIGAGIDAPTDRYTGEQRMASGGTAASKTQPSTDTKYSYDPNTMQYTQTTTAAPTSNAFGTGNPFIDGMFGVFGVGPYAMGGNYGNQGMTSFGLTPALFKYAMNQQGGTQAAQPAVTTQTMGGTITPYTPTGLAAAAGNSIVPNIQIPQQQNVDRQLGLEAFYPMMEQQLALKGSNLQARGYAAGGSPSFNRNKQFVMGQGWVNPSTQPAYNPYANGLGGSLGSRINNPPQQNAAAPARTYTYNAPTQKFTDNMGQVTGGLSNPAMLAQPQAQPANPVTPNINIPQPQNVNQQLGLNNFYSNMNQQMGMANGMTGYQGYAGGGELIDASPKAVRRLQIMGGVAGMGGRELPPWATEAEINALANSSMPKNSENIKSAPTYTYNPATMQYTDYSGKVSGGMQPQFIPMPMITPEQQMGMTGYQGYAEGGTANGGYSLGSYSDGGRLLRGPGDGVSDSIPASIGDRQPARLADGEFVVPARIVSEIGNGSTEAGARKLYAMMDRVQKARRKTVGKGKVAVNTKADKLLPA